MKHLLADRSVSMDLGQTPEVAVTLGDRSYKVSFSVLENPVSPAAFGIRQVKMLSGLWYWPEPTRPGYIELGDGGRIDLLPFDPVESSNVISFLNTVERHPKAFAHPLLWNRTWSSCRSSRSLFHETCLAAASGLIRTRL